MPPPRSRSADDVSTRDHALPDGGLCCFVGMGAHAFTVQLPTSGTLVVGRGTDADLQVPTEGVSRQHALLEMDRLRAKVRDLDSRNGTFVNGERIQGARDVGHGDEIQLGDAHLTLFRAAGAAKVPGGPIIHLHAAFVARLGIEMGRAYGLRRSLSVVILRMPQRWYSIDAIRTLLPTVRTADFCGALADDVLEIALPDTNAAEAARIASAMRDGLRAAGAPVTVGVATLEGNETPAVLVERALATSIEGPRSSRGSAVPARAATAVVSDPEMLRIHEQARRIAPSSVSVLIIGETGVGKEVLAHAVHAASGRSGRFVAVNVAALPEALVESELFGHERGAFTGATAERPGLFEAAHMGTLFLDEIGELPLLTQAKLLRVLEETAVRRVGGTRDRNIDVRFVAATNVDLAHRAADGRFRQDLMFRLNGCSLVIPPLRERPTEIHPLALHFLARAADGASPSLCPEAIGLLARYGWPGNVRELKNAVERALAMARGEREIRPEHLPDTVRGGRADISASALTVPPPAQMPASPGVRGDLDALERERIIDALARCAGNRTQAAKMLGLPRKTLAYRIERLGIEWEPR